MCVPCIVLERETESDIYIYSFIVYIFVMYDPIVCAVVRFLK